jgi:hypothetical protein
MRLDRGVSYFDFDFTTVGITMAFFLYPACIITMVRIDTLGSGSDRQRIQDDFQHIHITTSVSSTSGLEIMLYCR